MGAPVKSSPPIYYLGHHICPNCHEPVFAAEFADVKMDTITYRWTCDLCGHGFTSEAKMNEVAA
jgi:ribosomal protein S27AE